MPFACEPTTSCASILGTCCAERLAALRGSRANGSSQASNAGPLCSRKPDALLPKSNGIQQNCFLGLDLLRPTWPWTPTGLSASTIAGARLNRRSKRAGTSSTGPACHVNDPSTMKSGCNCTRSATALRSTEPLRRPKHAVSMFFGHPSLHAGPRTHSHDSTRAPF